MSELPLRVARRLVRLLRGCPGRVRTRRFRLRRIGPGIYAGMSYLREQERNYNLWVLIR